MRLQFIRFECGACGRWFEAPEIDEYAYGEFLLRSSSGETRYLDARSDSVFEEVTELIGQYEQIRLLDELQRADILHKVFGCTCDRDSQGNIFVIGENAPCSYCRQHNVVHWTGFDPAKLIDVAVQPVTHNEWQRLSDEDKRTRLRECLSGLGMV